MKALVTGGAGFIGSHLVEKLVKKKIKVTVIDNLSSGNVENLSRVKKKIQFFKEDLNSIKKLKNKINKFDHVFHLAGLANVTDSFKNKKKYYKANVSSTLNLIKFLKNKKIKNIIYAASASCYGNSTDKLISEKAKISNLSPYAKTKWISEKKLFLSAKFLNTSIISLRLFNVYGIRNNPKNQYAGVITNFINQKVEKKPFTIFGNGKQTRSFIYVSDVVDAMIKASKSNIKNDILNLGASKAITINSIADTLKGKKIFSKKKKGDPMFSNANVKKIKKKLSWKPKVNITQGINLLLKYSQKKK